MKKPRVIFETTDFQFAHGKAPRGFGVWVFAATRRVALWERIEVQP